MSLGALPSCQPTIFGWAARTARPHNQSQCLLILARLSRRSPSTVTLRHSTLLTILPTAVPCSAKRHLVLSGVHSPSIRPSIGTENPITEEMDHREIAVRVPVMNEVQFLFPSEPCKLVKSRSLYVVFLVEKDMRVERRRTCDCLNHEEIDWQYEVGTRSHQKHRNEEEGCIVVFVTEVRR